jgi:hypothetical protein
MLSGRRLSAYAVGSALGLTATATAAQPAGSACAGRKPRVGVMLPVLCNDRFLVVLREGLREAGWAEDDIEFEVRRVNGSVEQFRGFAQEFAAMDLDALITASTAAAALKQATGTIPIVFVGTVAPVAAGLVASMERPGGNATGTAVFQTDIAVDWVATLKEIAPQVGAEQLRRTSVPRMQCSREIYSGKDGPVRLRQVSCDRLRRTAPRDHLPLRSVPAPIRGAVDLQCPLPKVRCTPGRPT